MATLTASRREERGPVETTEPVRVLVVEDHDLYRRGLVRALRSHPDIVVVGEAPDGYTAERMLETTHPEVMLLDMRLPGRDGITIIERLRDSGVHPAPSVLVLSAFTDDDLVWRAVDVGAAGYLDKEASQEEIVDAVLRVARGGIAFTEVTAAKVEAGFDATYGRGT